MRRMDCSEQVSALGMGEVTRISSWGKGSTMLSITSKGWISKREHESRKGFLLLSLLPGDCKQDNSQQSRRYF